MTFTVVAVMSEAVMSVGGLGEACGLGEKKG